MSHLARHTSRRAARQLYLPRLDFLESRTLLTAGTFIEDFSNDLTPANPGFDLSGAFAHNAVDSFATAVNINNQAPAVAASPSPPHALFLIGQDVVTFPSLGPGEIVTAARVGVHPLGGAAQVVFQGTTDRLTFNLPAQTADDPWQ